MRSIAEIKSELQEAENRERLSKIQCTGCSGKGWFFDTTYNRTGESVICGRCFGSGLPKNEVDRIIYEAFKPFRKSFEE